MEKTMVDVWQPNFYRKSDLFQPIIPALKDLHYSADQWPSLHDYQILLNSHTPKILNKQNIPIEFVQQAIRPSSYESQYEPRIYLRGEVQTRLQNWHDFFQVLVWKTFPKTKTLLNKLHFHASSNRLAKNKNDLQRSTTENFLTLFDECGIVVVSQDSALLDMIKNFKWEALFWENREAFESSINCFVFGHAMYEKALAPYIGMTANALLIHVDSIFFKSDNHEKLRTLDTLIVNKLNQASSLDPRSLLSPLPILGVPHWHEENNTLTFYLNERYFRKGRSR